MLKNNNIIEIINNNNIEKGLEKYNFIMNNFKYTNISKDLEFQKVYKNFYKVVRRSRSFIKNYFEYFESIKNKNDLDFTTILKNVSSFSGYLEMSFSSKILHTINPDFPIWDSIVTTKHFGMKAPAKNIKYDRITKASEIYNNYTNEFYKYMKNNNEAKSIIKLFDEYFHNNKISNVKKNRFYTLAR